MNAHAFLSHNLYAPIQHQEARRRRGLMRPLAIGGLTAAALAALAVANHRQAARAERANPPIGRFLEVNGVRLHYLERGTGSPLVLLHGNGGMTQDFLSSGLVDEAARTHRVRTGSTIGAQSRGSLRPRMATGLRAFLWTV